MKGPLNEWEHRCMGVYVCVCVCESGYVHIGADCSVSHLTKVNKHNEQ